ncbi:hypothetical protein HYU08_02850 [Candidatus Woesearchaeota archaeon]|nr:hypothetical protein [Candidatus Woesearchaeota archaeon]
MRFPDRKEELTGLVKAVLQDPERLKSRDVVAELSRVVQHHSIYLSDEERDMLGRANAIHSYRFDNLKTLILSMIREVRIRYLYNIIMMVRKYLMR